MASQLPPEVPVPTKDSKDDSPPITSVDAEGPIVTRRELYAYYLYYNGDNGVGPLGYAQTLFQSLANAAGTDPSTGGPCGASSAECVLPWAGTKGGRTVSSIVLIANGLSFMVSSHHLISPSRSNGV